MYFSQILSLSKNNETKKNEMFLTNKNKSIKNKGKLVK